MPEFWEFWRQAEALPRAQQAKLFRSLVVDKRPAWFTKNVIGRDPTKPLDLDARITEFLVGLPPRIPAMKRISKTITTDLASYQESFNTHFPAFKWDGQVIFTVSLDAFDGALRGVNDKQVLMFGVDKIAKLYGDDANLAPLFHHELFHVHHLALLAPDEEAPPKLYQPLWFEGLAVYVAKTLNPDANAKQLTLSDEMVQVGRAEEAALAGEFLRHLDSSDETRYRDFFRGSGQRKDIPTRMGYYVGLRVSEHLGRTRDLNALAALKDPELRSLVAQTLGELSKVR